MSWQETSQKGVFARPIGENETFLRLVGDSGRPLNRELWAVNLTATLVPRGSLKTLGTLTSRLRRAWARLRFEHPSIAAEVATGDDKRLTYTVPANGAVIEDWVLRTFTVVTDAASSADVIPTIRPTPSMALFYVVQSQEVIMHTAHWRSDGIGILVLLDALLDQVVISSLDSPATWPWGDEVKRLAASIEYVADVPRDPTPEQKQHAASLIDTFKHTAGAVGIPYLGDESTVPGGTRSTTLVLSTSETDRIVSACKARGVSVTSAVHASIAGANYALADPADRNKHYASSIRCSLASHLNKRVSGAGLYTTGWMKRVEANETWDERLRAYQTEYRKGISREHLDAHREFAIGVSNLIRNPPPQPGPPSSGVEISSLGLVDKFVKPSYGDSDSESGLEVQSISEGVELLGREASTFVWTFRGRLNLHVIYNESFHSEEQMSRFAHEVKSQLLEGLGL